MPKISVVIPCYYNEGNIPVTVAALRKNEEGFDADVTFEYIFIDDASGDDTLDKLELVYEQDSQRVKVVVLAENVGSYDAICAGIQVAEGDCLTVMSADLQDPPELIQKMYARWLKGSKVVIAVRERRNDPAYTKLFAAIFHGMLRISGLKDLPKGGFDFCLFDRSLIPELLERHVCGINTLMLLLQLEKNPTMIPYERRKREIGTSKWTFKKKLRLAFRSVLYFTLRLRIGSKECFQIKKTIGIRPAGSGFN